MSQNETLLQVEQVSKHYRNPPAMVLAGIDLAVATGESVAIVGPSGSGKSTLLNIIGALDRPDSGRVLLDGCDYSGYDDKQLAQLRNRDLGLVFQMHHLLPQCSVWQNVLVPTLAWDSGNSKDYLQTRAEELLARVELADRATHLPGQLSGGECQRVAVVRALINSPRLLLADEPTGSLDQQASAALMDLLVELNRQQQLTLIVVTHSAEIAARMQRVLTLRSGKLSG